MSHISSLTLMSAVLLALNFSPSLARAESALEQLPFGIKIGVTRNSEIDKRGVCTQKVSVAGGFRCQSYSMMTGKFIVNSSQNETVSSVVFVAKSGHALPQKWQDLGIKLCPEKFNYLNEDGVRGIGNAEFLNVIKKNGAQNIKSESVERRGSEERFGHSDTVVEFDVGPHHFVSTFQTEYGHKSRDFTYERGLMSMEITESY